MHLAPIWRDRADFIIGARVLDVEPGQRTWEQLWARRLSEDRFELCCIPFFTYDLALGDHVETGTEEPHLYMVRRVVERSSHYTFRVWFGDSNYREAREELPDEAERLGCL